MKCSFCQTENPDTRKFCRECGLKFSIICPQCSSENIPCDKFFGECGQNLTQPSEALPKDLSFEEKIEKIQKYLPKGLTGKILSRRYRIESERILSLDGSLEFLELRYEIGVSPGTRVCGTLHEF